MEGVEVDPTRETAGGAICRLERELIVRDFLATFNAAPRDAEGTASIAAFLHPNVVYRPSLCHGAVGRNAVARVCEQVRGAFETFVIEVESLLVGDGVILVEHAMRVGLIGVPVQNLMGFSSFQISGELISEWHQVHV
ncbi:nuclear transport factor 2 family protein [Microbacterium sp.]